MHGRVCFEAEAEAKPREEDLGHDRLLFGDDGLALDDRGERHDFVEREPDCCRLRGEVVRDVGVEGREHRPDDRPTVIAGSQGVRGWIEVALQRLAVRDQAEEGVVVIVAGGGGEEVIAVDACGGDGVCDLGELPAFDDGDEALGDDAVAEAVEHVELGHVLPKIVSAGLQETIEAHELGEDTKACAGSDDAGTLQVIGDLSGAVAGLDGNNDAVSGSRLWLVRTDVAHGAGAADDEPDRDHREERGEEHRQQ